MHNETIQEVEFYSCSYIQDLKKKNVQNIKGTELLIQNVNTYKVEKYSQFLCPEFNLLTKSKNYSFVLLVSRNLAYKYYTFISDPILNLGLTLLDVLSFLRREDSDEDLSIQLQVRQNVDIFVFNFVPNEFLKKILRVVNFGK